MKWKSADQLLYIFVMLLQIFWGILEASRLIPWEYTFRKLPFRESSDTVQLSFACDMLPNTTNECSSEMAGHFLFCQTQQRSVNLWQFLKLSFKGNIKPFLFFFFLTSQYQRRNAHRKREDREICGRESCPAGVSQHFTTLVLC